MDAGWGGKVSLAVSLNSSARGEGGGRYSVIVEESE